jgi:Ca2+-binding RTX toxin-like protein
MPTLSHNRHQTTQPGLAFSASGQTWIIAPGVQVSSTGNHGVLSQFDSDTLINHGHVQGTGAGHNGPQFNKAHVAIGNAVDGIIEGHDSGIELDGHGASIANAGKIIGHNSSGIFFELSSTNGVVLNSGQISGAANGILMVGSGDGSIDNSGTIHGGVAGITLLLSGTATLTIHNEATGAITAGPGADSDSIFIPLTGKISFVNDGQVTGKILVAAGNLEHQAIVNNGVIAGLIRLGGGNDTYNGTHGQAGAIIGGGGNDRLVGGPDADHLHGGAGNDVVTGNGGADNFVFDTALDAIGNVDRITDFTHAVDKIELSHAVFANAGAGGPLAAAAFFKGAAAHDPSDRILYDPTTGFLSYDADGTGSHASPIHFAMLAKNLAIGPGDFVVIA